jgi:hypothetical protein
LRFNRDRRAVWACRPHLIGTLVSVLHEVDFVKADGSRNEELDRVYALACIARDLAEELMINTRK